MEIQWIAHACFKITTGDNTIYTDPYKVPNGLPKGTIILVSHEHHDHAEEKSIEKLVDPSGATVLVCPKTCAGKLKKFKPVGIDPGEETVIKGIKITAFPAYTFPGKPFHPRENKWIGFIIEAEGKKIYHAGDCDIMEEMKEMPGLGIDVALLPVGDKGFTMDFDDATKAAGWIQPRIVVPMHDWDQDLGPFVELVKGSVPSVKVDVLKGKNLSL